MGDLLNAEVEVFEPQAVDEEVDVPGLIVSVIVPGVLLRVDDALLLIVAQQICGDTQHPGHITDLVFHWMMQLLSVPVGSDC